MDRQAGGLRKVFEVRPSAGRDLAFEGYRRREGRGLDDYATWAAIAEVHGADSLAWPAELKHPDLPAVARFREQHAEAVEFHQWLQWVLDEQLAATQLELRRAGMGLGVMTDLAVGVHWSGADAWSLQETYAGGVTVGAPPDPYNQNGQDWQQPPWRPDRLAETAYEPFRRLVAAALRNAGGLRVDHVIGLFRLWWIPKGAGPTEGTYVRYDHEAMIGILALEAHAPTPSSSARTSAPSSRGCAPTSPTAASSAPRSCGSRWTTRRRRRRRPARRRTMARVVPGLGDDPRPAADGRLPRRRPRAAARVARACSPARWRRSSLSTPSSARPGWASCAGSGCSTATSGCATSRRRPSRRCTPTSPARRRGCAASR